MGNLINRVLQILKERVRQNIKEIQYNQQEINHLLTQGESAKKADELNIMHSLNKELLEENDAFIKMQMELTEFMEKYSHLFTDEDDRESDEGQSSGNDLSRSFDETISGKIVFDTKHPHFNDPVFFEELLRYYKEREDYEKCQELIKLRALKN